MKLKSYAFVVSWKITSTLKSSGNSPYQSVTTKPNQLKAKKAKKEQSYRHRHHFEYVGKHFQISASQSPANNDEKRSKQTRDSHI